MTDYIKIASTCGRSAWLYNLHADLEESLGSLRRLISDYRNNHGDSQKSHINTEIALPVLLTYHLQVICYTLLKFMPCSLLMADNIMDSLNLRMTKKLSLKDGGEKEALYFNVVWLRIFCS